MNQTEKVAKWLFDNELARVGCTNGDDWDSIQGRPLWEKVIQRYLAKAQEIIDLIDQQGEPVKNLSTKVGSLSDKKAEPVAWATLNTVDKAMQYTTERPGPLARLPEWPERAADGWCVRPLVYLHPPASREREWEMLIDMAYRENLTTYQRWLGMVAILIGEDHHILAEGGEG